MPFTCATGPRHLPRGLRLSMAVHPHHFSPFISLKFICGSTMFIHYYVKKHSISYGPVNHLHYPQSIWVWVIRSPWQVADMEPSFQRIKEFYILSMDNLHINYRPFYYDLHFKLFCIFKIDGKFKHIY